MTLPTIRPGWLEAVTGSLVLAAASVAASAQQLPIGSVSTLDATVTGASSVADDRAQLGMSGTVVAKDHVAYVQLYRGGSVKVCATSGVHLTDGVPVHAEAPNATAPASNTPPTDAAANTSAANISSTNASAQSPLPLPPLMVALDRGAMEIRMASIPGDIVMTPDLRFTFSGEGQLDLHIRVTRNGDTCVENRVAGLASHPELRVGSLFGTETYNVLPGQHVLFEGGSLREVVDNESSPCGCPEEPVKPPAPEAVTLLPKKPTSSAPAQAAAQHPFPAAVSQGLAPPPPVPQAPPGEIHTQIAATLSYPPPASDGPAAPDAALKPPPTSQKSGFFHSIGRFFKHIF